MQRILAPGYIALILCLQSCSTAMIVNSDEDKRLRTLSPPADKALVYIVRPNTFGCLARMPVTCDGAHIGATHGRRYIYAFVDPGKREFISKAENNDELVLIVEAGKTYFFEQNVKGGVFSARNELVRLDEEPVGRKKLALCKLAKDCPVYSAKE